MTPRHAICLSIDGLRASALGTYGNTVFPTPHCDALASRSTVVDWLIADSPQLDGFYRSVWQGKHAFRHASLPTSFGGPSSAIQQLKNAGLLKLLFTDDAWLSDQSDKSLFDEAVHLENEASSAALEFESTCLARFFSSAIEQLQYFCESTREESSLVWLHSQGMCGPWDAPQELRDQLLEEEDPQFEPFIAPPKSLHGVEDPDQLLAYRIAYGAQMTVLDYCLGAFVEAVSELFANSETLLMLFGSRGMPLGEHGSVGMNCAELYSEQVHLPWLLWTVGHTSPLPRQTSLAQPADLIATLLDWFERREILSETDGLSQLPFRTESALNERKMVTSLGPSGQTMIRTPAWSMLGAPSHDSASQRLFTKPDDRWECNDVSALCPEVVKQLAAELLSVQQACKSGQPLPLVPESEDLVQATR